MKTAIQLAEEERKRQILEEGFSKEHDIEAYKKGELMTAARCYEWHADTLLLINRYAEELPESWPWTAEWWKPSTDPVRSLVKAAALFHAERDRANAINDFIAEERSSRAYNRSLTRIVLELQKRIVIEGNENIKSTS